MDIIDKIEEVRKQNNINWMNILRIALTAAPHATKLVLAEINQKDQEISSLLGQLVNDSGSKNNSSSG